MSEQDGGGVPTAAAVADRAVPPALLPGVELLGEYEGSGFTQPYFLARRPDGQVVQLSRLLYLVAGQLDGRRPSAAVAARVSEAFGRTVSAGNVDYLVANKLRPLGVAAPEAGAPVEVVGVDPLLALTARRTLVPERAVSAIARVLAPLFSPVVIVAVLAGLAAFDGWMFALHGVGAGLREVLTEPVLILFALGLTVVSMLFHECGHAAGCRYGGARPGVIGVGFYLVWPAFYTNVTDAYRLGRAGRVRTDLGGIYFNAIFIMGIAGAYFSTGYEPLLVVALLGHFEILQQLLPVVRLDGYFILGDLAGVPDLFGRVKPILASLVPRRAARRRAAAARVADLKRRTRVVVTAWVLLVIPALVANLALVVVHAPGLASTAWRSVRRQMQLTAAAAGDGRVAEVLLGAFSVVVLALPAAGIVYLLGRLGQRGVVKAAYVTRGRPLRRLAVVAAALATAAGVVVHWTGRWP